ncbi:MAG TPA: RNA-directed DNA polymerase [Candidatus Saccharimonadales bacterium]|nr:RNA-directed DNA polymerase [Candidatus Saccharimonadales bacterium]
MTIEDVQRPYSIVKADAKSGMNFVRYPYELELFSRQQDGELERIKVALEGSTYIPKPCSLANVPKGKGAVRPGAILTIEDQVAYTMLVDSIYPQLHSEMANLQGVSDFAYQLQPQDHADTWFKHQFTCWNDFKNQSLAKIANGHQFVVVTDVTGCYENIDLNLLIADLRRIGAPEETVSQIRKMLKKWSQVGTKGLPQGVSASHLLAKLYMSGVDVEMRNAGYTQFRFVDDIRIFCNSIPEAKKALMALTDILRRRGLNLQSAKSKILQADEARLEIAGKATVIDALHARLRNETDMIEVDGYPYAIEIQINTGVPNPEQLNIIKQAFRDYFLLADDSDFDKSLFHYLLNKLGNANDDIAVAYCLDLLERHPEETSAILKYLSKQNNLPPLFPQLITFMNSENAVYDYQNYLIAEWLLENGCHSSNFKTILRANAFDNNKPSYYRAKAKQALGAVGDHSDLIRIRDSLHDAPSIQEKQAVICSLTKLESSVRNTFLSETTASDSDLTNACEHTRSS